MGSEIPQKKTLSSQGLRQLTVPFPFPGVPRTLYRVWVLAFPASYQKVRQNKQGPRKSRCLVRFFFPCAEFVRICKIVPKIVSSICPLLSSFAAGVSEMVRNFFPKFPSSIRFVFATALDTFLLAGVRDLCYKVPLEATLCRQVCLFGSL